VLEAETRYTRTPDGVRIAYQYIDGRDPVLLYVPQLGFQFHAVEGFAGRSGRLDALRGDSGWAMLAYRGTGLSGSYLGEVTVADLAADVAAVADDIGQERPLVLVGVRGGARPAAEFARANESRVVCLFLAGPGVLGLPEAQLAAIRANWNEGWWLAARVSYPEVDDATIREAVRRTLEGLNEEVFWSQLDALGQYDLVAALKALKIPLILQATDWDQEASAEIAAALSGVALHTVRLGMNDELLAETRRLLEPHIRAWEARSVTSIRYPVRPAVLTARQLEVLRLVAEPLSNRAIAERLAIAEGTVARHVSDILDVLQLESRTAATRYAVEYGLTG
jgi:DNA-binding NarL/FixJ family response regulator